jgi:tetratricopeptide (TPR) repeat protein
MAYPGAAQAAAPTRPAPPTMKPAAPASPAAPPEDAAALVAQLEQMKKLTYFEVLGVKRDADANAVKIAYLKAARSYHPDTVPPGSPEALARAKADLFALIGEANRTLSDPKLREEYVGELDAGGSGSKIDIEKLLRAEELFQKGRILVQARKYPDALKLFEEAIACNADEAEFYAWRGYARFLVAPDKKNAQSEVMKDLKHCLAKNPNVSATHYFLGYVAKALGDTAAAKGHFKKCVELDPRHIDAARELRMMK